MTHIELQRQLADALFRKLKLERVLLQVMKERDELQRQLEEKQELLPEVPYMNPVSLETYE